jgi:hypothetical protein
MPALHNPLFVQYKLECTHPGCPGVMVLEQAISAGWKEGQLLPEDKSHPDVGRCPRCQRYMMKVVSAPPPPKPVPPKGWVKVPTK